MQGISGGDVVLLGECNDQVLNLAVEARQQKASLWFLGSKTAQPPEELFELCEAVVVSREFVDDWRPGNSIERAFREIVALGPQIVIVTDGKRGGLAHFRAQNYQFATYAAEIVDSAGAGDAFAAGVVLGHLDGMCGQAILRLSCACAALNIQKLSASYWPKSLDQVSMFLRVQEDLAIERLE